MNAKKWIKLFFKFTFLFVIIIASINFIVDPGNIYLNKIISQYKALEYTEKLVASPKGLVQTGWNERLISTTLASKSGEFDCIIVGSSHSRQISSVRNTGNINNQCRSLLNLSVSGASIEDIAILSYFILHNNKLPKKVFINIDPWTLKFKVDKRYGAYKEYLEKMDNILLEKESNYNFKYWFEIIKNLVNVEYFLTSVSTLKIKNIFTKKIKYPEHDFSYEEGYEESITLADGSHVYNKKWLKEQKNKIKKIKVGGGDYHIRGEIYDKETVLYLQKLISLYKSQNIIVSLIMTPYHPNVFKVNKSKPLDHIKIVNTKIREFAEKNDLKVYGSFYPQKVGCKEDEFLDFMHATSKCLNRINFAN